VGQPAVTVTQGGSGTVSVVLFDATAGERVNVFLNDANSPGCNQWQVLLPNGAPAFASGNLCGTGGWSGQLIFPQAGTYTIEFVPSSGTGTFTAQIIDVPPDATASLSTTGATSSIQLTTPGQHADFLFSGTAGSVVSVYLDFSYVSNTNCAYFTII